MVKCPKCSLQNPDTQKFCGECGTSLLSNRDQDVTRTTTFNLPPLPLPPGSIFADRYRIIEELGKGGMGRVVRALDLKLDEEIAIKFIRPGLTEDPATVERFRTELKAARQVVHKNVARMFDLNEADGVSYISMEYVKGGDLKSLIRKIGRLDAQQAVRIATQVAAGLAEAHRIGVIHRDIKPHNIMVDEEGTARITDFGLARLRKADDATMTAPGMGTPAYASPEQVEGTEVDNRSDLYSLGIVLYEMLTGKTPFKGDSPYSVALARLAKPPPDPRAIQPDIPEALVQIIIKCLQREREQRYQNGEELIRDLEAWEKEPSTWLGPRSESDTLWKRAWAWMRAVRIPLAILAVATLAVLAILIIRPQEISIAVLPVKEINPSENRESFWFGLQSDINAKLGSIEGLRIVPWPSVPTGMVADNLLQLTLRTEGIRLLVDVELIDAKSKSLIRNYPRNIDPEDLNTTEDEIVRETARDLHLHLNEVRLALLKKRETKNPDALNFYWEGMRLIEDKYFRSYDPGYFVQAVEMYKRAIELDPNYALAYWGLGNAYEARYNNPYLEKDPGDLKMMQEYYLRAHEIAPDFAETNLGLGWVNFNYKDNIAASKFFKRAFELEPDNFVVNQDIGAFLRSVGLYDKAIKYLSRAADIDPHSISAQNQIFVCLICLGKFEKAYRQSEKVIMRDLENLEARTHNAIALIMMSRLKEAEKQIETTRKINPKREMSLPQALLWAARGEKEKAMGRISERNRLDVNIPFLYIFLGMNEQAISAIEEGIEHGFEEKGHYMYSYPMLTRNPFFKSLRRDPRFQEILRREKAKYKREIKEYAKF